MSYPGLDIYLYLSNFSKKVSQLTAAIKEIHIYLELVYKYPRNVYKKFYSIPSRGRKDRVQVRCLQDTDRKQASTFRKFYLKLSELSFQEIVLKN